jgi:hypothetical protein
MEFIKDCADAAHDRLNWLLKLENSPFTLNTHYYADYKDKFFGYYKSVAFAEHAAFALAAALASGDFDKIGEQAKDALPEALAALARAGMQGLQAADFAKLLPPHAELERALGVMAEVRAYYQGLLCASLLCFLISRFCIFH